MRNKYERKTITNKLAVTGLICCILGTAGCVSSKSYLEEECENGICTSNREYTAVCVENADGYSECSDAGNINYTRGAADFREYGERSPRDHRITQAGAGNNISAAIPPSIDNEVVEYENGIAADNNGYAQPWNPAAPIPQNGRSAPMVNGNSAPQNTGSAPTAYTNTSGGRQAPAAYTNTTTATQPQYAQNGYVAGTGAGAGAGMHGNNTQNSNIQNGDDDSSEESSANKDWLAEEGQSLKELLTMWSDEAGWRLIWKTNRNYTLNAGAMFRGNFADVASALIRAFARARPAPVATFYKGNRVLVVETMEDENAYD
ncbi:MAG: toxin co-regulated pilus biosynthesis Q family protein [Alphaproteobacteria bacterium]|nr:toxin co-regulated pilus biosynthesis Q family protein [Alphaproteobacteria bacterium]